MQPIKVYLDSSDYSHLSEPNIDTLHSQTLEKLRAHIKAKNIVCYYSGIHLSEMAPIGQENYQNADRRISLLYELCGPHTLIAQDRVIQGEISHALEKSSAFEDAYSNQGEWYPFDLDELVPSPINLETLIEQEVTSATANPQQAKLFLTQLKKNPNLLRNQLAKLQSTISAETLKNITKKYPMKESDALVLSRYTLGLETSEQATAALKNSFHNLIWVFSWLKQNPMNLEALSEWTRSPARSILEEINNANAIFSLGRKHAPQEIEKQFQKKAWDIRTDNLLKKIVSQYAKKLSPDKENLSEISAAVIKEKCPGLTTGISSLYSAWKSSLLNNPRPAKQSDFQDGLHSTYAPYVDIFRADSFMAPHIQKFTTKHKTKIVPKLKNIVEIIEDEIENRKTLDKNAHPN